MLWHSYAEELRGLLSILVSKHKHTRIAQRKPVNRGNMHFRRNNVFFSSSFSCVTSPAVDQRVSALFASLWASRPSRLTTYPDASCSLYRRMIVIFYDPSMYYRVWRDISYLAPSPSPKQAVNTDPRASSSQDENSSDHSVANVAFSWAFRTCCCCRRGTPSGEYGYDVMIGRFIKLDNPSLGLPATTKNVGGEKKWKTKCCS